MSLYNKDIQNFFQSGISPAQVCVKVSKSKTLGGVNLQRSYEIVQAVIANSPNREQLQAQVKPPVALMSDQAKNIPFSHANPTLTQVSAIPTTSVRNIASPSNQLQTITVLKTVGNNNGQVIAGQLVGNNQRMMRSVTLPVTGTSNNGGTVMVRQIVSSPASISNNNNIGSQVSARKMIFLV